VTAPKTRVSIVDGDITRVAADAIVNAAAGPELQAELDRLGGCPTGPCRISRGHRLPAPWIIHAVGHRAELGR